MTSQKENHDDNHRRKEDPVLGAFIGEIRAWKDESIEWRKKVDTQLASIAEFMEEVRTPRRIIIWAVRAFFVSTITGIGAALVAFVKGHVHFN